MRVFGVKITANQAFLIFRSLHFCFLVLFACPFSQSSGTLDSLHPVCLEYIISHPTQVALHLKCLQNLTLCSKFPRSHSCRPVLRGSSLLSPALSVSWLMSMTQARQTGQQGSGFPGPKVLAAPRSVERGQCRKVLRTRPPVVQATSSEQGQEGFQGSFSTEEVVLYASWSEESHVLGRTEWLSASETLPTNPISGYKSEMGCQASPYADLSKKSAGEEPGYTLCVCVCVCEHGFSC